MAVPGFQALMLPMLELLSDGQVRRVVPDVADELAGGLGLTDADREETLPSGAMATFINRTHWAATYMVKAGLLHRPKRGHAVITERGLQLLATKPDKVNIALLTQYPEFEEFRKKKSPSATPSEADEEENPEESLAKAFESWRKTVEVDLLDVL